MAHICHCLRKCSLFSVNTEACKEVQNFNRCKVPLKIHEIADEMKVMNEENEINCNYSSDLNESPKKQPQNRQTDEQLSEMITAASRCLALEQAYVHDVYSEIARECGACSPVRSHIKQFVFDEFEFGSLLMDIGCGDCKYLNLNADIFTVGLERCEDWFHKEENVIRNNSSNCCNDLLIADLVFLPIRDEFFDGVLCCGVLHHLSTTERRIKALNEMCRIMKIGGKLMITVWAFEGRELGSQDVLIKWNTSNPQLSNNISSSDSSSSSSDDDTSSSCSTTLANYVNRKAAYESCNSPTSEFGTCYSFVRRALQKFNLAPTTFYQSPRRQSKSSAKDTSTSTSGFATLDDVPIELRNIDEKEVVNQSFINYNNNTVIKETANNKLNGDRSLPENSSRRSSRDSVRDNYGSIISLIKEHILPKSNQKSSRKESQKAQNNNKQANKRLNGFQQRFSLPTISLRRKSERMRMSFEDRKRSQENSIEKEMELKTIELISEGDTEQAKKLCDIITTEKDEQLMPKTTINCKKRREIWREKILQKSLSSDSLESKYSKQSRQQSTGTESTAATSTSTSESSSKLVAYYSMPELRLINGCSNTEQQVNNQNLRMPRNKPNLADLHPITFLNGGKHLQVTRNDSQDTQTAIEEIGTQEVDYCHNNTDETREKTNRLKEKLQLNLPQQVLDKILEEKEDLKDCKKSRSLSVEYKSRVSPSNRPPVRRFSVSPSLLVSRTIVSFVQQESQHETHPSVDSEESFVTIIAANRSCRGSVDNNESFIDDVMMDMEQQSAASTTEEDALCENLSAQQESDDNTSASTVSTKSVESLQSKTATESKASTPSPPANLHRYFHLFRCGELEELIEKNIHNLHVLKSYYSEHATSWCIVAEKVQVWTI